MTKNSDDISNFDLSRFLPYQLAVLSERVSRRLTVEYNRMHGLNVAEWRVLVHLQWAGRASVRDIARYANLDKPKVSRAVARLEKAGLLEKSSSKGDGRLVDIALTTKGQSVLSDIIPVVSEIESRLLNALSESEAHALNGIMDRFHEVLDNDQEARRFTRLASKS